MSTWRAAATRLSLILLLLCAVVAAQTVSLESFHQDNSSSHHCCGLCHAGMPFVRSAPTGPVAPIAPGAWVEESWAVDAPHDVLLTTGSSRAPPSL